MLIILSGQYLESELAAEFGAIPPAFLPVGNRRLYERQIAGVQGFYDQILMTLPEDFALNEPDRIALENLGVVLYATDPEMSLGEVTREVLHLLTRDGRIDLLFGDTLIKNVDLSSTDWLATAQSAEFYQWHFEPGPAGEDGPAWCGMFSFADSAALRDVFNRNDDFIDAVDSYRGPHGGLARRNVEGWLDFGHVHTYFISRLSTTTQRHFNQLSISNGVISKSSDDRKKMQAEATWFAAAPSTVRPFLPNFIAASIDAGPGPNDPATGGYAVEYLPLATLNELYVFGRLPTKVWNKIIDACAAYLDVAAQVPVTSKPDAEIMRATYLQKTFSRLAEFKSQTGISLTEPWLFNGEEFPSLYDIAGEMARVVLDRPDVPSFIHGDLCFSNILFDFRCGRVKLIDPRGLDARGCITSFGDLRYDIGKLSHSVVGLYDLVVAGHYKLSIKDQEIDYSILDGHTLAVRDMFLKKKLLGRLPHEWDCFPVMVLLFLSMLPLHRDNPQRQSALMANSLRLYKEFRA